MADEADAAAAAVVDSKEERTAPARVALSESEQGQLTAAEWAPRWRQQDQYVSAVERRLALQEGELCDLRQTTERLRLQLSESQQRERALVRRLAAKEQEAQDYVCQLTELKGASAPGGAALRGALLDPAVNCVLQQLRSELRDTRAKLEDTQNELNAWKFTPDSNTGKRLMAKCRLLYQENEELGRAASSGRVAKLEGDLALRRSFAEEVRQSQNELDSFLADLDEDVEGMQSTILFLQQQLRRAKEETQALEKQNGALLKLADGGGAGAGGGGGARRANGDSSVCEQERTDSESSDVGERTRVKRVRRSSVLSIDYHEDDTLLINTNGDVAMSSDPE